MGLDSQLERAARKDLLLRLRQAPRHALMVLDFLGAASAPSLSHLARLHRPELCLMDRLVLRSMLVRVLMVFGVGEMGSGLRIED